MNQSAFQPPTRLTNIAPSQIRENMRIAREVGAVNLAQGRPDFATDARIKQAAIDAINNDHNQYSVTWGLAELRAALSADMKARFGYNINAETEITITCGVTEGMNAVLMSLVEPGDEVIVVEPAHENYVPAISFAGGVSRFVTLRPPTFAFPTEELEATINERTRALILNTPHNPSGHVFTRDELKAIIDICTRRGVYIITDEIYDRLLYDGREHIMPAAIAERPELIITTAGLSKIYAATGWRLGYVLAAEPITAAIRTVHDYLTICAPTPFQHAAVTALALPQDYYDDLVAMFTDRRDRMMRILSRCGFKPHEPEGAYYLLAEFDDWNFDGGSEAFTKFLIRDAKVATVPGSAFYYKDRDLGERIIRFAFAKSAELIDSIEETMRGCFEGRCG
jgi:aspartate/methionine/tyrosine aminotransferase